MTPYILGCRWIVAKLTHTHNLYCILKYHNEIVAVFQRKCKCVSLEDDKSHVETCNDVDGVHGHVYWRRKCFEGY